MLKAELNCIGEIESLRAELERVKSELAAEKARFFEFIENLPFFAYLQSRDYSIRYANRKFRELYGEPAGRACYQAIRGRAKPCESCPTFQVFETREPVSWESSHPDGRSYQVFDIPFTAADGTLFVLEISIDNTQSVRLERESGSMLAKLMLSQKMGTLGALAAGIAHDFNNIISAIKMLNDLAIGKIGAGDPLLKFLEPVRDSSERALSLVQQLLLYSRNKPVSPVPLNVNEISEELMNMLRHVLSEDISIETEFAHNLRQIKTDRNRIEQIILSLFINASEAMPAGGRITLRTGNMTEKKGSSGSEGNHRGNYVVITVEDTGTGMAPEVQRRIFEPMFTTKSDTERNAGMGLKMVQAIVNEHGGWIEADSAPGKGSIFRVHLAAMDEASPASSEKRCVLSTGVGRGKRILLVEDDKWVRKSTAMALSEYGYAVFEAAGAEEALSFFYREKGSFDLIMTDMVMPGRSGLELVTPLLDLNPRIPVLVFSGYLDDRLQMDEIIRRGYAFLHKPFEIPDLLNAVEDTISQGASSRPRQH